MSVSGTQFTDINAVSGGDLTSSLYRFVRSTGEASDGSLTANLCVSSTGGITRPKGILQNEPSTGEAAKVRVAGLSKLVAGEGIAVGAFVSCSTEGTGLTCGTTGEWAAAVAESASTASGQIISVRMLNVGHYFSAGGTA
jgi:hypothetical protein